MIDYAPMSIIYVLIEMKFHFILIYKLKMIS